MKRILHLYVAGETLVPAIIGLFLFTFILLANRSIQLIELILRANPGFAEMVRLLFLLLPSFLVFSIPMSILLGNLAGFARLSDDNELLALRTSGVSLPRLLISPAAIALAALLLSFIISTSLLPRANLKLKESIKYLAVKKGPAWAIEERVFNDKFPGLVIYVDRILAGGNKFSGIMISDEGGNSSHPRIIIAKSGHFSRDTYEKGAIFTLYSGAVFKVAKELSSFQRIKFKRYDIILRGDNLAKVPLNAGTVKEYEDMGLLELARFVNTLKGKGKQKMLLLSSLEFHKRIAFPFACLIFMILGVTLGSRISAKTSKSIVISIMLFFVYYLLLIGGENVCMSGLLPPFLAIWSPNILFGILGGILLYREIR